MNNRSLSDSISSPVRQALIYAKEGSRKLVDGRWNLTQSKSKLGIELSADEKKQLMACTGEILCAKPRDDDPGDEVPPAPITASAVSVLSPDLLVTAKHVLFKGKKALVPFGNCSFRSYLHRRTAVPVRVEKDQRRGYVFNNEDFIVLRLKRDLRGWIGVKSKLSTFGLQRFVNDYREEPLLAIFPGGALQELWGVVGTAEQALVLVSAMVVAAALLGLATMILSTLSERRREMAILRSVGASPRTVIGLLMIEAGALTLLGVLLGVALLYLGLSIARPIIDARYGLYLPIAALSSAELAMLALIVVAGFSVALLPALRAYKMSLADGMTVRI